MLSVKFHQHAVAPARALEIDEVQLRQFCDERAGNTRERGEDRLIDYICGSRNNGDGESHRWRGEGVEHLDERHVG